MADSDPVDPEYERLRRALRPENKPYSAEREERFRAKYPYLRDSPEEYVARHAHTIWVFCDHCYRLRDARLKAWLQAVYDLLRDREQVARVRRQFLTPEQIADVERIEQQEV